MAVTHPEIVYAQRSSESVPEKNIIYLTISASDIQGEPKLDIEANKITFHAKAGDSSKGIPEKEYAFDIELFDEILPEETKKSVTSRAIVLILRKKAARAEYWPRLTKEKVRNQWIKTDFSKWVDEDEQDEVPAIDESEFGGMGGAGGMPPGGMGGMPPGMMGGMGGGMGGGMPGMGGMDMASLMSQMGGGAGGAGGAGGMDFEKLMAQMGQGAGGAGGDFGDDEDSDDGEADDKEDEMPSLEKK